MINFILWFENVFGDREVGPSTGENDLETRSVYFMNIFIITIIIVSTVC